MKPEEAAKVILEGAAVDPEQWRLGHTKVAKQPKYKSFDQIFSPPSIFI